MLKTYKGSCHCGAVRFETDLDLENGSFRCNCSTCRRTRFWPAVEPEDGLRITTGEEVHTEYLFNTRSNQHSLCQVCNFWPSDIGNDTPIGSMYGVYIGCLGGVTEEVLSRIPITYIDGVNDKPEPPVHYSHL